MKDERPINLPMGDWLDEIKRMENNPAYQYYAQKLQDESANLRELACNMLVDSVKDVVQREQQFGEARGMVRILRIVKEAKESIIEAQRNRNERTESSE